MQLEDLCNFLIQELLITNLETYIGFEGEHTNTSVVTSILPVPCTLNTKEMLFAEIHYEQFCTNKWLCS